MHLNTGKSKITQAELAVAVFGFMGYALIPPHYFGIRHNCSMDREAFVHFWAVIGHMLGIEENFNMCLNSLKVVEILCTITLQYFFTPFLQIETTIFRQMITAIVDGMSEFLPMMTYEFQMFRVKRIAGLYGYQYKINSKKDKLCKHIFSNEEMNEIRQHMQDRFKFDYTTVMEIGKHDDSNYKDLCAMEKFQIYFVDAMYQLFYQSYVGRFLLELGLSWKLSVLKKYYEKNAGK